MVRLLEVSPRHALGRGLARLVPAERELIIRSRGRMGYLRLGRTVQSLALVALAAALGWTGYVNIAYVRLAAESIEKDRHIALTDRVNAELRAHMTETRRRFLDIAGTLEDNHGRLVSLVSQNRALKGDLVSLQRKLQSAEAGRKATEARSHLLRRQLAELEDHVRRTSDQNAALANNLQSLESERDAAIAGHSKERERSNLLAGRVAQLRGRLKTLQGAQTSLLRRLTRAASGDVERVKALIEKTGLSVDDLLAQDDRAAAVKTPPIKPVQQFQGGPFIPMTTRAGPHGFEAALDAFGAEMDRWQDVRHLLGRLPLLAPIGRYRITSGFGERTDPINKRSAFHAGIDIAAPINGKVRSTAPGKVVHAGWQGRYGRLVEIDHGLGIRTRYGHLAKVLVKEGDAVDFRTPVGLLGNSGRSTGAHLHYEILIDGKPVDPRKFIQAGRHVFKG